MIYQSEAAECGLACVAMIADIHGRKTDLPTLRNKFSISLKGANLQQLMAIGDHLGMAPRALRLELHELGELCLPCILHWEMNHFVVLKKVSRNYIVILDPAVGERRVSMSEVDKSFTGVALELTPNSEFKKIDERVRLSFTSLWSRSEGLIPALVKLFVISIVLQAFVVAAPYYTQLVVDESIISHDRPLLIVLALGFGLLSIFQVVAHTLRSWVILHIGSSISLQMATNLMSHLLRLPLEFFEKRHVGDIASRFESLNSLRELVTKSLVEGIIDGIMALTLLFFMAAYSVPLCIIAVVVVGCYAIVRAVLYHPIKQCTEASIVSSAKEQSVFLETLRSMQSVKIFCQQTQRLNLWSNRLSDSINQTYRVGILEISYTGINQAIFGLENILVIYLAAVAVMSGELSVGMLFAYVAYKTQFTTRMTSLIDKLIELRMARLHLSRISEIAFTEKESSGAEIADFKICGSLSLDNVAFRHPGDSSLLFHAITLHVSAGEHVAIVGPSGTGKTSLLKLMIGLTSPESGRIEIDGNDIRHIGIQNFRSQISAVMQDDSLMSGTLAQNISFFDQRVDIGFVIECAQMAGIHHEISEMPMGYDSLVGDMGSALSGGQKQRILLARALYRKPKILFMDEATSHLDSCLERKITGAIASLQMTRITIAHRRETILSADRVMELKNGTLLDVTHLYRRELL